MTQEKQDSGLKVAIQKLGSNLSSMVMPNIGAFIAWGIFAALFIPTGYLPHEGLNEVGGAMQKYLLPLLIAYSGGSLVHDQRGGVVGAIATMGVIVGTDVPMFIGAMIMGPLGGWCIKKFDQAFQDKIPQGFEMLVNNFSSGIIAFILAILGYYAIGPVVATGTDLMAKGVSWIIERGLLPLANVLIEPAKVLFLNNAINHGILTPLGTQQVSEIGKSVLFLLEANPGPGLGILLAFALFGKGSSKSSSWGAMLIHFFGGIHEIYFPYVMTNPLLIIAQIAGGVVGTFLFRLFNVGLSAPASPGSIIAIMGVTARGDHLGVLAGVLGAALVSFLVAVPILKADKSAGSDLESQKEAVSKAKAQSKGQPSQALADLSIDDIKHIIFACDAGMGSSAMGASLLRKKAKELGLSQDITNSAISKLNNDPNTLVITQNELTPRAKEVAPDSYHVSVENFLDGDYYDALLAQLISDSTQSLPQTTEEDTSQESLPVDYSKVEKVVFVYLGKVGASTMAASNLRNGLTKAGKSLPVEAIDLDQVSDSADLLVICDEKNEDQVRQSLTQVQVLSLTNLLDDDNYTGLLD